MTPNILSSGTLILKEDHPSFKILEEMISLRNRILHNKDFLKEFDLPLKDFWEKEEFEIFAPLEKITSTAFLRINACHLAMH